MKPKKLKAFVPEVAAELGYSEEEVAAVVQYYWARVRKTLTGVASSRVSIANLGEFTIKHWLLPRKLESLERRMESLEGDTPARIKGRLETRELMERVTQLLEELKEADAKRAQIKNNKQKIDHV